MKAVRAEVGDMFGGSGKGGGAKVLGPAEVPTRCGRTLAPLLGAVARQPTVDARGAADARSSANG